MANASKRNTAPKPVEKSDEYQRFESLVRQVISVPKSEIDKRQAEYERERKKDTKKKKAA